MDAADQVLVSELRRYRRIGDLRRSEFYREHKQKLDGILKQARIYRHPEASPALRAFLRIAQWNILYGTRLPDIISTLKEHPVLKHADVLLLNEVDDGTSRCAGVDVAAELSAALGASAIYAVEYLELADGAAAPESLTGRVVTPVHGNAILTRHPFDNTQVVRLPRCENNFESAQKRLGGRAGLIVDIDVFGRQVTVATTHLDVVNTPRCRGSQIRGLLQAVDARKTATGSFRAIVGGDFNTHTFVRGTPLGAIQNISRILFSDVRELRELFLDPAACEPALTELERFGFQTGGFNDGGCTNRVTLEELDRTTTLPGFLKRRVLDRLQPCAPALEFRLDWFAGYGVTPLEAGEAEDAESGVQSVSPLTLQILGADGSAPSDHDPIAVDICLPPA
ncbi:MAG TPA: endonuclease/exonuclease/phosphatase family protein [Blastocatellia bacterium]|nr:endonuclease/exonuclease/phosphatase family protein [Blastocatellia bacterium]